MRALAFWLPATRCQETQHHLNTIRMCFLHILILSKYCLCYAEVLCLSLSSAELSGVHWCSGITHGLGTSVQRPTALDCKEYNHGNRTTDASGGTTDSPLSAGKYPH